MGGVRIGGAAAIGCADLGFAVIGPSGIWMMAHNEAPVYLSNSNPGLSLIGDPVVSPNNCLVAYTYINNISVDNRISVVATNDLTAPTDYASEPGVPTGLLISAQTSWSPSGQYIVWGSTNNDNTGVAWRIGRVNFDGSNVIDLYAGNNPSTITAAGYTRPIRPRYSDDGSKIMFWRDAKLTVGGTTERVVSVMDADGTNVIDVAFGLPFWPEATGSYANFPCWLSGTTTIVYSTSTVDASNGNVEIRKVEADGTGDTLLYTDPEDIPSGALYGTTPFASLPDGSGVLYVQYDPGLTPFFDYRVGVVDAAGGGWSDLGQITAAFQYNINLPVVRDGRVWWDDGMYGSGGDGIVSMLPDGSDFTVEDNTNVFNTVWFG